MAKLSFSFYVLLRYVYACLTKIVMNTLKISQWIFYEYTEKIHTILNSIEGLNYEALSTRNVTREAIPRVLERKIKYIYIYILTRRENCIGKIDRRNKQRKREMK